MAAITQPRAQFPYTGSRYGSFSKTTGPDVTVTVPRIVQRVTSSGHLALSGTYSSASADTVQVKVLLSADDSTVIDWADVDVSLSGDAWSGSVNIPTGGPYYCQARLLDSGDSVLATSSDSDSIICGDVFVSLGQSNAVGFGTNNQTYSGSSVAWVVRQSGTIDTTLNDPSSDGGSGSWEPLLATLISAHVGSSVPIAFVNQSLTATALVAAGAEWSVPSGSQWLLADALVDGLNLNAIKAVLWFQGERDVSYTISKAVYKAAEAALALAVNSWPGSPQLISTLTGQQSVETDAEMDAIRLAKIENWTNGTTRYGANTIDINLADGSGDGIHFKTDAELAEVAARIWLAVKAAVYSGASGRGPRVLSATYVDTSITITMDQELDTATSYTASAWIVKDDGTPVTVTSVDKSGNTQLVLTLSAARIGTLTVTFGSGDDAIVASIPRALSVTLPATINGISSVAIPAEPFVDYAIEFEAPDFMHGVIGVRPYLFGTILVRSHLSGKLNVTPHLHSDIRINP